MHAALLNNEPAALSRTGSSLLFASVVSSDVSLAAGGLLYPHALQLEQQLSWQRALLGLE